MKRIAIIIVLLLLVWVLSYALAFTLRERNLTGFRYPPAGRMDRVLYPLFLPLYRLHGWIDTERPRHERDLPIVTH